MINQKIICVYVGLFCLSSCLMTRSELLEKQSYQEHASQESQMQKASRFDPNARIEALEEALRFLNGKVEELEQSQKNWQQLIENKIQNEKIKDEEGQSNIQKKIDILLEELKQQKQEIQELKIIALSSKNEKKDKKNDHWKDAESFFKEKNWKRAILSYQKYREQNPKGPHYAEATYKIGFCFDQLQMKEEALGFYQEVINQFPKSSEAQKAKVRIKNLK